MGGIHEIEVGVDKEVFFGGIYVSGRGGVVWDCVKDNVVGEKEEYKAIGLYGFYYKLFGGGG